MLAFLSLNPAWVAVLIPACTLHVDLFQEPMEETLIERENDYVTIEEVVYEDSRLHNQKNLVCPFHKLTKSQARCLQVYFQWLKISVIYVKCLLSIILRFYVLSVQRNDKMWLHLNFGSEQFGLLKWNFHGIFIHYQSLNCDLITFELWLRTIWTFEMKFPWNFDCLPECELWFVVFYRRPFTMQQKMATWILRWNSEIWVSAMFTYHRIRSHCNKVRFTHSKYSQVPL